MEKLKNRYFGLRHGRSEANEANLIVSAPENGVEKYGLIEFGRKQVEESVEKAIRNGMIDSTVKIFSSDFLRTKQTAELAAKLIGIEGKIQIDIRLRERFFGNLEGLDSENYMKVWGADLISTGKSIDGIESLESVMNRMWAVIVDCEGKFSGEKVLLVSHGDPLQILSTKFIGASMKDHRKVAYWNTGEMREFKS